MAESACFQLACVACMARMLLETMFGLVGQFIGIFERQSSLMDMME